MADTVELGYVPSIVIATSKKAVNIAHFVSIEKSSVPVSEEEISLNLDIYTTLRRDPFVLEFSDDYNRDMSYSIIMQSMQDEEQFIDLRLYTLPEEE